MMPASIRKPLQTLTVSLVMFARISMAHTTGLSTSDLNFGTNGLDAVVTFAGADMALALGHLETTSPTDANRDGTLTSDEIAAKVERIRKFTAEFLTLELDGQKVLAGPVRLALDENDNFRVEMNFPVTPPGRLRMRAALFAHLPPDHSHFIAVHESDGKSLGNKMLNPKDDSLELELFGDGTKSGPHARTFSDFFMLGIEHIWTGYDHLLFLFALLLVCGTFKSAVQVVTCFTVAHSITMAFATLNLVWMDSRVVEPAIAASIIYVGVENFVRSEGPKGRWLITFLFGLIHGFGFATVLRDMGVASSTTGVALPLAGFNLGVEAGQIAIAGVLLPVIWKLRKYEIMVRRGVPACSAVVAALGVYWLVQRVFFG